MTVTCKRFPTEERGSSNQNQQRSYEVTYRIEQTDGGTLLSAPSMITAAQSAGATPLPLFGDDWSYEGTTDLDSYAQQFTWSRPEPADKPKLLDVTVSFLPAESINPGRLTETDPLLWPVEYWVEWTEEQIVLDQASNLEELLLIERPALTLGKVVNACGVEFTEPLMKTVYYPVLHCQKQYATLNSIVALNTTYQNTTNNSTFFGAAARTAKYLGTESGRIQKVHGQSFYVGITRIWFKKETWDRKVLNNGWSHFEFRDGAYKRDADGRPKLFRNKVHDDPVATEDDSEPDVVCSEPLNLTLEGTLVPTDQDPEWINYRHLDEVDYAGIGIGS